MALTDQHQTTLDRFAEVEAHRAAEATRAKLQTDLGDGYDAARRSADRYTQDQITYGELSGDAKEILIAESDNPTYTRAMFEISDAGAAEDAAYYEQQAELWEQQGEDYAARYEVETER